MKTSHSLTSQFSCCCYLWVLMFSTARDFSPIEHIYVCVNILLFFVYISFNVCSFVYVVTTNLLLSFIFPFTPSLLSFVNYCYVTPSNQAPPHPLALCVSWSLTCCTWLRNYIVFYVIFLYCVPCIQLHCVCMCIVFEKFVLLTFWKKNLILLPFSEIVSQNLHQLVVTWLAFEKRVSEWPGRLEHELHLGDRGGTSLIQAPPKNSKTWLYICYIRVNKALYNHSFRNLAQIAIIIMA